LRYSDLTVFIPDLAEIYKVSFMRSIYRQAKLNNHNLRKKYKEDSDVGFRENSEDIIRKKFIISVGIRRASHT